MLGFRKTQELSNKILIVKAKKRNQKTIKKGKSGKLAAVFFYGIGSDKSLLGKSKFIVVRDEVKKKTFYEVRIPLSSLGIIPQEGVVLSFNFVIFDGDIESKGYEYWCQLSPGITMGKASRYFKKFMLVK